MTGKHIEANKDYWNAQAPGWVAAGERLWAAKTPEWGNWGIPDGQAEMLPTDMTGMTAIELGCGTGYVSGWMVRRGAEVTAVDQSKEQLATAKRLAVEHETCVAFIEANAEAVPLSDSSFDFAVSEYGAAIWCDPDIWVPEAHRLLRRGGTLAFLGNHPLTIVCSPLSGDAIDRTLHRPYRKMHMADWTEVEIDPGGIEFNRTFADWMDLFQRVGFEVLRYQELFAPPEARGMRFPTPADWAHEFPVEQIWILRKR